MSNKCVFSSLGSSNHSLEERQIHDYYATNPDAVDVLLKNFDIPKNTKIWECACGEGHLSKRLIEKGYDVYSSDIIDRGYGEVANFFEHIEKLDAGTIILTNPPYCHAMEFVLHSLNLLQEGSYCIMFLKLLFLEGQKRLTELFRIHPPKTVYVFSKRMLCVKNGEFNSSDEKSSAVAYCWFVWQKGFKGKPVIEWI